MPGRKPTAKSIAKRPSKHTLDQDPAITVTGELVLNPMTGVPLRAKSTAYDPSYPELIIKLFTEMLEKEGSKRADSLTEDEFIKDLRKNAKDGGKDSGRLVRQEARKQKSMKWSFICAELPSLSRFGRMVGCSERQVRRWRERYPSFDDACDIAQGMLESVIVQRSLTGQYDADFAKFLLKNWLGWKDRTEITGADGAPLNPPQEFRVVSNEDLEEYRKVLLEARQKLLQGSQQTA